MEHRPERRKKTIHRIHRLQGQLSALERSIEEDTACENVVIQMRAIEKSVASLIVHVVRGFLNHQIRDTMQHDPDLALEEVERIFELLHR